jgi:hypothetical protein
MGYEVPKWFVPACGVAGASVLGYTCSEILVNRLNRGRTGVKTSIATDIWLPALGLATAVVGGAKVIMDHARS